jgi:hypothetical protein
MEDYINQDSTASYEKPIEGGRTMLFPKWPEVHESRLIDEYEDSGKCKESDIFSTEAESPFVSYEPKLDHTTVFVFHVLKKWSFQDIAVMLDTDAERVRCLYKDSTKRLLKALEIMDTRRAYCDDIESMNQG